MSALFWLGLDLQPDPVRLHPDLVVDVVEVGDEEVALLRVERREVVDDLGDVEVDLACPRRSACRRRRSSAGSCSRKDRRTSVAASPAPSAFISAPSGLSAKSLRHQPMFG